MESIRLQRRRGAPLKLREVSETHPIGCTVGEAHNGANVIATAAIRRIAGHRQTVYDTALTGGKAVRLWERDNGAHVGHNGEDDEFDDGAGSELHSAGRRRDNQFSMSVQTKKGEKYVMIKPVSRSRCRMGHLLRLLWSPGHSSLYMCSVDMGMSHLHTIKRVFGRVACTNNKCIGDG